MAERAFPHDDTEYLADDLRMWFIGRTCGVINATREDFITWPSGGMQITVGEGYAYIKTGTGTRGGVVYGNTSPITFDLDAADSVLDRIDAIVLRYDKESNSTKLLLKKGVPASNPVGYWPDRSIVGYELVLKYIHVDHGIGSITEESIKDVILDETLCGLASDTLSRIPTQQFQNAFDAWFEHVKGQLTEDTAGNLQYQIDTKSRICDGTGALIENGVMTPNTNILVNSDFVSGLVNQKGLLSYEVGNKLEYTIDMWRSYNVKVEIIRPEGGITITNNDTVAHGFRQQMNIINRTATLMIEVGEVSGRVTKNGTKVLKQGINIFKMDNMQDDNISIILNGGTKINLKRIKLELGNYYTGMQYWDRTIEELKCRKRLIIKTVSIMAYQITSNKAYFMLDYEPMEKTPTCSLSNAIIRNKAGSNLTMTDSIEVNSVSDRRAILIANFNTNISSETMLRLSANVTLDAYDY